MLGKLSSKDFISIFAPDSKQNADNTNYPVSGFRIWQNGALAQLVEQWTENPCVPGSIPGGTTFRKRLRNESLFLYFISCAYIVPF